MIRIKKLLIGISFIQIPEIEYNKDIVYFFQTKLMYSILSVVF